jgi:hypothetical protein
MGQIPANEETLEETCNRLYNSAMEEIIKLKEELERFKKEKGL